MADIKVNIPVGFVDDRSGNSSTFTSAFLSTTTTSVGMLFRGTTTEPITHIGLLSAGITGTPPTYKVTLEGKDGSTGLPDGTIKGGVSPASAEFTPTGWAAGEVHWIELDNSYTPSSINEVLWATVRYSSGTVDGSNRFRIAYNYSNFLYRFDNGYGMGCTTTNDWSSASSKTYPPAMAVRTATERFGGIISATTGALGVTASIATNGHRKAVKWSPGATLVVDAIRMMCDPASAGGEVFGIWDASGTLLSGATLDADTMTAVTVDRYSVPLASPYTLTAGTTYYIGIERGTATCSIPVVSLDSADDRLMGVQGTSVCLSDWNGSTWTDDTTKVPYNITLVVSDVSTGGGGGGSGGGGLTLQQAAIILDSDKVIK